jgi:hypothetical protein
MVNSDVTLENEYPYMVSWQLKIPIRNAIILIHQLIKNDETQTPFHNILGGVIKV